jgi:hypothetical protein
MGESALKKLIDCLNKQSDALHGRDHFWTTCLIVGCAFEILFVCHEYLEDRNDWHRARSRGFLSFPEKPPIKWLILEILGVILVLGGIGGELRVSILAGRLETRLREANGQLVLLLEGRANDAEAAAKGAIVAAKTARSLADAAGTAAGHAQVTAGNANAEAKVAQGNANAVGGRVDSLNTELTATAAQLGTVESKRAKLEEALSNMAVCNAPRVLKNWYVGATNSYVDALKPYKGSEAVLVFIESDSESKRAASAIEGALDVAGWKFVIKPSRKDDPPSDGVLVESNGADDDSVMLAFVKFLHSNNWEARPQGFVSDDPDIPHKGIKILVGLYPPSEFVITPNESSVQPVFAESGRQFDELRRSESLRQLNERIKSLSPKEAIDARSKWELRQRQRKSQLEKYEEENGHIQPCRPLSSLIPEP